MTHLSFDPNDIDWHGFAKSIAYRIEAVGRSWRKAKHDFNDDDYDRACIYIFMPLIAALKTFVDAYDELAIGRERMNRMN